MVAASAKEIAEQHIRTPIVMEGDEAQTFC